MSYEETALDFSKAMFNFIMFIVLQTSFFFFVVAEFPLYMFDKKVKDISVWINRIESTTVKSALIESINSAIDEKKDTVEKKSLDRAQSNQEYLISQMQWPFYISVGLYIIFTFMARNYLNSNYIITLIFILASYLTEVGIYFTVIQRINYIGTSLGLMFKAFVDPDTVSEVS